MRHTVYFFAVVAGLTAGRESIAQDLPESSPAALLHHAQGVDAYVKERYLEAVRHFAMAHETDPTSYVSLLMAGVAATNAGRRATADSFYALVLPHKDKLSGYYRYRLEAQMAGSAGNAAGYIAGNRKAAELGPGTKAWYNVAQGIIPRGQAAEGRNALRQLDPDKEPMKGWYSYSSVYMDAAHALGDHEDELKMARRARAAFPGDVRPMHREAIALAALGRAADAERALGEVSAAGSRAGLTPSDAYVTTGLELAAHGNEKAGTKAIQAALAWRDGQSADSASTPDALLERAYALYALGRYRESAPIFAQLAAAQPANAAWKAWIGVMAALNGDRNTALATARQLESGELNPGANAPLFRGLIAAALNDRDRATSIIRDAGFQPMWLHRDPMLRRVLGASVLTQRPERE